MKKRILSLLLIGITVVGLTGCGKKDENKGNNDTKNESKVENKVDTSIKGDNSDLVDALNGFVNDEVETWKKESDVRYFSMDHINDIVKNKNDWKYEFISLGNNPFTGKYDATTWKSPDDELPDYEGKRYYRTIDFSEKESLNDAEKFYLLVYDEDKECYYNITITFNDIKIDGDDKTAYVYPIFSNSKLLK